MNHRPHCLLPVLAVISLGGAISIAAGEARPALPGEGGGASAKPPLNDTPNLDEDRAAWRYRREVRLPPGRAPTGFAVLPLPPDMEARCQPELRDLRLIDPAGTEVAYLLTRKDAGERVERAEGQLTDTRREPKQRTTWQVDLGERRTFDTIELNLPDWDFAKRVTIEAADETPNYRPLLRDAGVFDQHWGRTRVHHTTLTLPAAETARYLRVTADDRASAPVELSGVVVERRFTAPQQRWRRPVATTEIGSTREGVTYRLDVPPGLPIEAVEIDADDPAFLRDVTLEEEAPQPGSPRQVRGRGAIHRLRGLAQDVAGESLLVPVERSQRQSGGGALLLRISGGDSPPLRGLRVAVSGVANQILFPEDAGTDRSRPWRLYYGNQATRAPSYDLEVLRGRIDAPGFSGGLSLAELLPESDNPRFRPAPPLEFVTSLGAQVEAARWPLSARLRLPATEDLYAITLPAEALARSRPDLGDVRIVNAQDQQVPYVLEPEASERSVTLEIQPAPGAGKGKSRHRLLIGGTSAAVGPGAALPLYGIDLDFAEGFFSRPARLLVPAPQDGDGRGGERVVFNDTLSRQAGVPGTLRLPLPLHEGRYRELVLEIDDGDNAPLTLRGAHGAVKLPRLAFKLRPQSGEEYRVLVGNPEAAPPRYDIESLRRQVLDYAAVPVPVEGLSRNEGYRPRTTDYIRNAPPTLILWGTLIVAVIGLLLLTARLLRKD